MIRAVRITTASALIFILVIIYVAAMIEMVKKSGGKPVDTVVESQYV